MSSLTRKYITVSYELYSTNSQGVEELVEAAPVEHPMQFISNMGTMLPAFEAQVQSLNAGDTYDFSLSPEDAYGEYEDAHVIQLDKAVFSPSGHFDSQNVFVGATIPLVNEDGNRFQGTVVEVGEDKVTVDLNHPLAGQTLRFKGQVVTSRPATDEEIDALIMRLSGVGGCGCGDSCGCSDEHSHGGCGSGEESHGGCGCGGNCQCGSDEQGDCGCSSDSCGCGDNCQCGTEGHGDCGCGGKH